MENAEAVSLGFALAPVAFSSLALNLVTPLRGATPLLLALLALLLLTLFEHGEATVGATLVVSLLVFLRAAALGDVAEGAAQLLDVGLDQALCPGGIGQVQLGRVDPQVVALEKVGQEESDAADVALFAEPVVVLLR